MSTADPQQFHSVLKDPAIAERVETLLLRMNLAQKVGQMTQPERSSITPEETRAFHIGSVMSGAGSAPGENTLADWVSMNDAYWVASMEEDDEHLAIPILFGVDAIHGNNNVAGATIFPHNIGLGAARDPDLLSRIAQATAREVLASGVDWSFAPTLAVVRDCHWGRSYESYAQEPELVATYAGAFVKGLQGDLDRDGVIGCAKHWVGDGGTNHGIDQGNTTAAMEELSRVHMTAYHSAINAGVLTVMASLSSWQGQKCHGHHHLLTEVLKQRLNFDGLLLSDWDAIDYLADYYYDAIGTAVNAGIDMFMVSQQWWQFIDHLTHHVERGSVSMERIDDAVRRILGVKFASGLFEKPRPAQRYWSNHSSFGAAAHRETARDAVRKSLVLLKNDKAVLPLNRACRVFVAGKNAHNKGHQCGGFTISWQGTSGNDFVEGGSSVWEGIKAMAPNATLSADSLGADADPALHDVALVVIGETSYAEGLGDIREGEDILIEPGSQTNGANKVLEAYGSSLELAKLHPQDLETIAAVRSKGIPVVTVLISGRPLVTDQELEASDAFVAAWLPGSEGQGVADVLFGDYDFNGKLSFSWPGACGAGPESLFPYGYGLRYPAK
jgi:beta-glucosidase